MNGRVLRSHGRPARNSAQSYSVGHCAIRTKISTKNLNEASRRAHRSGTRNIRCKIAEGDVRVQHTLHSVHHNSYGHLRSSTSRNTSNHLHQPVLNKEHSNGGLLSKHVPNFDLQLGVVIAKIFACHCDHGVSRVQVSLLLFEREDGKWLRGMIGQLVLSRFPRTLRSHINDNAVVPTCPFGNVAGDILVRSSNSDICAW